MMASAAAESVRPRIEAYPAPFPTASKTTSGTVNGRLTTVSSIGFLDKILITISQSGKLAHWVHVPLSSASMDPANPGSLAGTGSENDLLPMTHLTATTILGGTKREEEVIGQTLATTIGSAILMQQSSEERLLVVGIGLENAAGSLSGRVAFDEVVGLVLEVLS